MLVTMLASHGYENDIRIKQLLFYIYFLYIINQMYLFTL